MKNHKSKRAQRVIRVIVIILAVVAVAVLAHWAYQRGQEDSRPAPLPVYTTECDSTSAKDNSVETEDDLSDEETSDRATEQSARDLMEKENYSDALELLSDAEMDGSEIWNEVCETWREGICSDADKALAAGEMEEIQDALNQLDVLCTYDMSVVTQTARAHYQSQIKEMLLNTAQNSFTSGCTAALEVLRSAPEQLKEDEVIQEQLDNYTQIKAAQSPKVDVGTAVAEDAGHDTDEERQDGDESSVSFANQQSTVTALLIGAYDTFVGTVSCLPSGTDRSDDVGGAELVIYGDDTELFRVGLTAADTAPVNFSLDVTGVMELKIQWAYAGGSVQGNCSYYLTALDGAAPKNPEVMQ